MPYIPEHQAVAPQQIQQPETFEASRLQSAAGYCQDLGRNALRGIVTSRAMRSALALGLAVGAGTVGGTATEMVEASPQAAVAFETSGYPDADKPCLSGDRTKPDSSYGKTTGTGYWCTNYDWGDLATGQTNSSRGMATVTVQTTWRGL